MNRRKLNGYCPMGCGVTLISTVVGAILCDNADCPRPTAVGELLALRNLEHEVTLTLTGFQVVHPLRERFDDLILRCPLDAWLRARPAPPARPGVYTATAEPPDRPGWWFSAAPGKSAVQALSDHNAMELDR